MGSFCVGTNQYFPIQSSVYQKVFFSCCWSFSYRSNIVDREAFLKMLFEIQGMKTVTQGRTSRPAPPQPEDPPRAHRMFPSFMSVRTER